MAEPTKLYQLSDLLDTAAGETIGAFVEVEVDGQTYRANTARMEGYAPVDRRLVLTLAPKPVEYRRIAYQGCEVDMATPDGLDDCGRPATHRVDWTDKDGDDRCLVVCDQHAVNVREANDDGKVTVIPLVAEPSPLRDREIMVGLSPVECITIAGWARRARLRREKLLAHSTFVPRPGRRHADEVAAENHATLERKMLDVAGPAARADYAGRFDPAVNVERVGW